MRGDAGNSQYPFGLEIRLKVATKIVGGSGETDKERGTREMEVRRKDTVSVTISSWEI